jgi:hypothetical protein
LFATAFRSASGFSVRFDFLDFRFPFDFSFRFGSGMYVRTSRKSHNSIVFAAWYPLSAAASSITASLPAASRFT